MKIRNLALVLLSLASISINSFAFENKEINSFKTLNDFKTVEEFEKYYQSYTKECLDNGFGGTGSIPCFVSYELWDKELNSYYKKLISKLDAKEKESLKKSQRKWIESRDLSIDFNSNVLDKVYTEEGTMYMLMRAGDADSLIFPIIKERALTLKRWYEIKTTEDN